MHTVELRVIMCIYPMVAGGYIVEGKAAGS
jgi:hypothetical protein